MSPSQEDVDVTVKVDLKDLQSMTDDELFRAVAFASQELQHRTHRKGFMESLTPEHVYLLPLGLIIVLMGEGKVVGIETAREMAGGIVRESVYDGMASSVNPLKFVKFGQFGEKNRPIIFLPHWITEWRAGMKRVRKDR